MARHVLITGGSGFVGQWTARTLLQAGWKVFAGTSKARGELSGPERDAVCWITMDVRSDDDLARAVETASPEWIVHLAGIAYPPRANADPMLTFEVNTVGTARLLTAVTELSSAGSGPRVLVTGSAEQYGVHERHEYPLSESAEQRPMTPYAASKAAQEVIALQICREKGLEVICTRSFNHSGPGQSESYVLPSLVRRALELPRRGGQLRLGSPDPVRDFLHVSDAVAAYIQLLERGRAGETYNVCSGIAVSVGQIATRVLQSVQRDAAITVDSSLSRRVDMPILHGDNGKLRRDTGWVPRRSLDDIIADLIHAATR